MQQELLTIKRCIIFEKRLLEISQFNSMSFHLFSQARKYWAIIGGIVQLRVSLGDSVSKGDLLYSILKFNKRGSYQN